jgi:hypothetical protein
MLSESIKLVVSGALLAVEFRAAPERCCATFCAAIRDAAAALPLPTVAPDAVPPRGTRPAERSRGRAGARAG